MRRSKKGLPPTVRTRVDYLAAKQSSDTPINTVALLDTKVARNNKHYQFFLDNSDKDNAAIANMMTERFPGIQRKSHMKNLQRWRKKTNENINIKSAA